MKAAFDDSAATYDEDFTNTSIGRLQRNKVWDYLEKAFQPSFPKKVFELNCGTGEDAIFFAEHGSEVLATDVSQEMLAITKAKVQYKGFEELITTRKVDISDLEAEIFSANYDLIFSDFGGLNCISQDKLENLLAKFANYLKPGGRIILVVMPKFCLWESIYFASKLKFKKAFRRRTNQSQKASLITGDVNVWYHDPNTIKRLADKYYNIKNVQPVGISLPPSYLQKTFLTRNNILNKLDALESKLNKYSFFAGFADHYLIDLELR